MVGGSPGMDGLGAPLASHRCDRSGTHKRVGGERERGEESAAGSAVDPQRTAELDRAAACARPMKGTVLEQESPPFRAVLLV